MLAASVGKMPAFLVVILALATTAALSSGLLLQIAASKKAAQSVFMPQRLESSENAPAVDIKQLKGRWVVQSPNYAMTLTFVGDRFEWIVKFANIRDMQFYARGNYRIEGDVMILGQRPDLGKPYDPEQPWLKYMPIAMKDLNTKFTLESKKMMWIVPQSEQEKILSHTAGIFNTPKRGDLMWVKK